MTMLEYTKSQLTWNKDQWAMWEVRVRELEATGITRSDAQGITDVEFLERLK